jgi:hypothetical protein
MSDRSNLAKALDGGAIDPQGGTLPDVCPNRASDSTAQSASGRGPGFGTAASGADIAGEPYDADAEVDLGHGSGNPNRPIVDEHGAIGISRGSGEGSIGESVQ